MLIGVFFAVVGATLVALGATVVPWFVHLSQDGGGLQGLSLVLGPWLFAAAAIALLSCVLALALRRRRIASVGLGGAIAVLAIVAATTLMLPRLLPDGLDAKLVQSFSTHRPPVGPGLWLSALGGVLLALGAASQLAAARTWGRSARLLRVSTLWNGGVIRQELLTEPRDLQVGSDAKDGLIVPTDLLPPRAALFEAHRVSGSYDLVLRPGLVGTLSVGGQRLTADSAFGAAGAGDVRRLRLGQDDWGKLDFGDVAVVFQFVQSASTRAGRFGMETWVPAAAMASVFTLLGFVTYLCWTWNPENDPYAFQKQDPKGILVDGEALALLAKEEEEVEEPEEVMDEESPSKAAPDEEGKFGDPDLEHLESKVPKNEGRMEKVPAKQVGLVDILKSQHLTNMGAMANILASNTNAMESKLATAMAGTGDEFVMGGGSDGTGFRGTGTGGGGEGPWGRIHGLGKIDAGDGGLGKEFGLTKKPMRKTGKLETGGGTTAGFCSKDNLQSVVRSRANAIRGCYENRLQISPNLAGKLTARWTVNGDGKVGQASLTQNSVSDGAVGGCVLGVIRRMAFQKPEGGVCIVQWPFVFNPG